MLGAVGIEPTTSPEEIAPICRLQCDTTADCSIFNRFSRSARLSASSVESPTWRWCEIFQLLSAFWSFGVLSKHKRMVFPKTASTSAVRSHSDSSGPQRQEDARQVTLGLCRLASQMMQLVAGSA